MNSVSNFYNFFNFEKLMKKLYKLWIFFWMDFFFPYQTFETFFLFQILKFFSSFPFFNLKKTLSYFLKSCSTYFLIEFRCWTFVTLIKNVLNLLFFFWKSLGLFLNFFKNVFTNISLLLQFVSDWYYFHTIFKNYWLVFIVFSTFSELSSKKHFWTCFF